jgi:hypothetical protein
MEDSLLEEEVGLTIYHELQHITSIVYDHPTKAYAKKTMVELAIEDPVGARLNSASYTMYIADTGLPRELFSKYTKTSGADARSATCFDNYGNCPELANGCCFNRMVGGGQLLSNACCAACEHQNDVNPKCKDEANNCFDKYSNCADIAKSEYQCQREEIASGCCKSCKKVEDKGGDRTDGKTGCSDSNSQCKSLV